MTTKNFKVLFFAVLIAAIAIPVSGMDFVSGQEQVTKQKLQIPIPEDSNAKKAIQGKATVLFDEKAEIQAEGAELRAKYESEGMNGLTSADITNLDRVHEELRDVNLRIDQMNADSRALITLTQNEREVLEQNLDKVINSNVPFTGTWTDENAEAVGVSFVNQEEANKYTEIIETIIDVPFYVEVRTAVVLDACSSFTSDCDPLLGGVQISMQYNSTHTSTCSYASAVDRNVWWWTDYGFLTAAHCFESASEGGADVWQPLSTSGKIGDLNMWKCDTTSASEDAAFVKKIRFGTTLGSSL